MSRRTLLASHGSGALDVLPGAMALVVALLVDVVKTHYGITNEFEVELAEPLKMTWDWSPAAPHMLQQDARSWSPCNFTQEPHEFFKCDMKHLVSRVMEFPTMLEEHFMLDSSSEINGNTCPMTCNSTWIGTTVVQVGELSEPFGDWNPGQMLEERIGNFLVMGGLRFLLVASLHESLQKKKSMAFARLVSFCVSSSLMCTSWISSNPLTICSFLAFLSMFSVLVVRCLKRRPVRFNRHLGPRTSNRKWNGGLRQRWESR